MIGELNERLVHLIEKGMERDKLLRILAEAEKDLDRARFRRDNLKEVLDREEHDVEALEGLSLKALFHTVLSSKHEQLEKERQEFLVAKLRFDEAEAAYASLEEQVAAQREQLAALGDIDTEYAAALHEKEAAIEASGGENAEALAELDQSLARARSDVRETEEALTAAIDARNALQEVIRQLQSARGWGTWDMLGGGLLSTAIKHSRIGDARKAAHTAQQQLDRFKRELADISREGQIALDIRIDGFSTFADFFFDGLLFDWIVQSKIVRSLEHVHEIESAVARAVHVLRTASKNAQRLVESVEHERQHFIEAI